jgi:hypothetical protein
VLDRSRSVARGGVEAEDPLDAAACVESCVVKTRYQILCKRIERVSRVVCVLVVWWIWWWRDREGGRFLA